MDGSGGVPWGNETPRPQLVSPSGMVETHRLQAKSRVAKCERSEYEREMLMPRALRATAQKSTSSRQEPTPRLQGEGGSESGECGV